MKRFFTVLTLGALFVVVGVVAFYLSRLMTNNRANVASVNEEVVRGGAFEIGPEQKRWRDVIAQDGAKNAYEKFKEVYATADFSIQHQAAHVFGGLIYEALGLDGVSVCDSSFAFGCYHSLFGTAIAAEGTEVVKDLDVACLKAYGSFGTGCQHGIGHGVMEYFGASRLLEALESCKLTTQKNPLFGCTSGVFMEYNMPTVISSEGAASQQRSFDATRPYAPCSAISEAVFAESCYYELSQWLGTFMEYAEVGRLCSKESEHLYRTLCVFGFGQVVSSRTNYSTVETGKICDSLAAPEDVLNCRSGAAWSFYAVPERRGVAGSLCDAFAGSTKSACKDKAKILCTYLIVESEKQECMKTIEI